MGIVHCLGSDVDPSKKAKPHLELWLEHLLLQLSVLKGKNSWIIGEGERDATPRRLAL